MQSHSFQIQFFREFPTDHGTKHIDQTREMRLFLFYSTMRDFILEDFIYLLLKKIFHFIRIYFDSDKFIGLLQLTTDKKIDFYMLI